MKVNEIPVIIVSLRTVTKKSRGLVNKWSSGSYLNDSIKIGQDTKESPGDLRTLVVTQTPLKDHRLTLL